jgi:hypothetical protein
VREQVERLEHHRRLLADLRDLAAPVARRCGRGAFHKHAADFDVARVGRFQEIERADEGGLAGAGRPHDDDDFTFGDIEVDAAQDLVGAECLGQAAHARGIMQVVGGGHW